MTENSRLNQDDIEKGLISLGLSNGMAVEVHSSLSSFGNVEGGAKTIIESLMNMVGETGALIMPTFPLSASIPLTDTEIKRGITIKFKVLAPNSTEKSCMGVVADTFRLLPGVVTGEGPHRVSAWGHDAKTHAKGFSHLMNEDGWALLLGVDIHRLTSMHYCEENLPDKIRAIFTASGDILDEYPSDQWYVETGKPIVDAWGKIQTEADRRGFIRHNQIGKSHCMFFKVRKITGLYKAALDTDPFGLYELK